MKRLALVLTICGMVVSANGQQRLTVHVLDAQSGLAAPAALVELLKDGAPIQSRTTPVGGTVEFFVETVGTEELPELDFELGAPYPNPASGTVNVPVRTGRPLGVRVTVTDVLGRLAVSNDVEVGEGGSEVAVSLGSLPGGTYFVTIAADGRPPASLRIAKVGGGTARPSISVKGMGPGGRIRPEGIPPSGPATKGLADANEYHARVSKAGYGTEIVRLHAVWGPTSTARLVPLTAGTIGNTVGMDFVRIAAGTFSMGSTKAANESPVHSVTLTNALWMGKFEVTQAQYQAVTGQNPSYHTGIANRPVDRVSWVDAVRYANALSTAEGRPTCYDDQGVVMGPDLYACPGYRLPTEAEWEYAVRAGTTTAYFFGEESAPLGTYAWFGANSSFVSHPVGGKLPNPWGLYDVYGNANEWVSDGYLELFYSQSPGTNPLALVAGVARATRGRGYAEGAVFIRSSIRGNADMHAVYAHVGFRLVRTIR